MAVSGHPDTGKVAGVRQSGTPEADPPAAG